MRKHNLFKFISEAFITALAVFLFVLCPSFTSSATEADPFSFLMSYAVSNSKQVLIVSQDDIPGCFTTVTEATLAANEGDVIYICPGVYNESIDLTKKELILYGQDRDSCIIKYQTTAYSSPVLGVSAGVFNNLTFYGYNDVNAVYSQDITGMTSETVDNNYPAYVIHIDDDYESGRSLSFINCNIISETSHCIGLGFRNHFSVSFDNCILRSTGIAGILYMHDPESLFAEKSDMSLAFRNCIWQNFGYPYVLFAKSIHTTNHINLTFQNVITYCYVAETPGLYVAGNAYTGYDLRLYTQFSQAFGTTPVYCPNDKKASDYLKDFRAGSAELLPGIYYLSDREDNVPDIAFVEKATVYYINNAFDRPGDGWMGSNVFWLTPDSFGNTLDEMNFQNIMNFI